MRFGRPGHTDSTPEAEDKAALSGSIGPVYRLIVDESLGKADVGIRGRWRFHYVEVGMRVGGVRCNMVAPSEPRNTYRMSVG